MVLFHVGVNFAFFGARVRAPIHLPLISHSCLLNAVMRLAAVPPLRIRLLSSPQLSNEFHELLPTRILSEVSIWFYLLRQRLMLNGTNAENQQEKIMYPKRHSVIQMKHREYEPCNHGLKNFRCGSFLFFS